MIFLWECVIAPRGLQSLCHYNRSTVGEESHFKVFFFCSPPEACCICINSLYASVCVFVPLVPTSDGAVGLICTCRAQSKKNIYIYKNRKNQLLGLAHPDYKKTYSTVSYRLMLLVSNRADANWWWEKSIKKTMWVVTTNFQTSFKTVRVCLATLEVRTPSCWKMLLHPMCVTEVESAVWHIRVQGYSWNEIVRLWKAALVYSHRFHIHWTFHFTSRTPGLEATALIVLPLVYLHFASVACPYFWMIICSDTGNHLFRKKNKITVCSSNLTEPAL